MKVVEFYSTTEDGQESAGQVVMDNTGKIFFAGMSKALIETLKNGVRGPKGKRLVPKDGIKFLEALQFEFTGSYLRASEVKAGKE